MKIKIDLNLVQFHSQVHRVLTEGIFFLKSYSCDSKASDENEFFLTT